MSTEEEDLRPEYPEGLIRSGERGKYAKRYLTDGTNLVRIDQDLLKVFPDAASINRALRRYLEEHGEPPPQR